jgi:hypothetical protein
MTWVTAALIVGGTSLVSGYMGAKGAKDAAQTQLQGTREGAAIQKEMFDVLNEQQKPYREAGYGALTRLGEMLPGLTAPVSREEILGLPGYQFAIDQGTGAARQAMNVGSPGSNVDRAAQKFALDYTLGTAMPQVISQRQNIYNTLAGIAGIGQTAQGQTSAMGQAAGTNMAQLAVGGANAIAGGQVGAANAYSNASGNIGNAAMMYALMKG